jgi:hypothetical protein
MRSFQLVVEGIFIKSPELGDELGGFHTTFFTYANDAVNAKHRTERRLLARMEAHSVKPNLGWPKTHYLVSDIWELSDSSAVDQASDTGFTFFSLGIFQEITLSARRLYMCRTKPWLLLEPSKFRG